MVVSNTVMLGEKDGPGDHIGIAGDFNWKSQDGKEEAVLRLQPSGMCWHAAHRQHAKMAPASKWWHAASYIEVDGSTNWEMAESLGSWCVQPLYDGLSDTFNGTSVLITCESYRWTSDEPDLKIAQANTLWPGGDGGELDHLIDNGKLTLCYAVRWCPLTGRRNLVLVTEHESYMDGGPWVAVQTLGFAKTYSEEYSARAYFQNLPLVLDLTTGPDLCATARRQRDTIMQGLCAPISRKQDTGVAETCSARGDLSDCAPVSSRAPTPRLSSQSSTPRLSSQPQTPRLSSQPQTPRLSSKPPTPRLPEFSPQAPPVTSSQHIPQDSLVRSPRSNDQIPPPLSDGFPYADLVGSLDGSC